MTLFRITLHNRCCHFVHVTDIYDCKLNVNFKQANGECDI